MATIIESTIGTGGAYATPAAWFAAAPASFVAADQVWRGLLLNEEFVSTSTFTMGGKTTDATHYFELTTAPSASFKDHASKATNALRYDASKGAAIRCTSSNATINVAQSYTRISNIQVINTNTGATAQPALYTNGVGTNITVDSCIFESWGVNSAIKGTLRMTLAGSVLKNSAVVQNKADATAIIAALALGISVHNCTLVAVGGVNLTVGVASGSTPATFKNVYIGGVVSPEDGAFVATKTNCYSNATATGYSVAEFSTNTFQNVTAGTYDLRLASGSPLVDAGATDAANAATDILGTSRLAGVAYDVGAWEAPAPIPTPIQVSGTIAWIESADVMVAYVSVGNLLAGNVSWVETNDTANLVGTAFGGTFVTEPLINNTGTILGSKAVSWSWFPSGRIGSMGLVKAVDGSGTTAADGKLTVSGLSAGAGVLMVAILVTNATNDAVYYEAGMVI